MCVGGGGGGVRVSTVQVECYSTESVSHVFVICNNPASKVAT